MGLLANERSIGRHNEIVGERLRRAPFAVINRHKDAKRATWLVIPVNSNLDLVCGARRASALEDLRFAYERDEFTVLPPAIPLQLLSEDGCGFPVVHVRRMPNIDGISRGRRPSAACRS